MSNFEEVVAQRFCDYVAQQASQALWWLVQQKSYGESDLPLRYIEFETNEKTWRVGEEAAETMYCLDAYLRLSAEQEKQLDMPSPVSIFVERTDNEGLVFIDEAGLLPEVIPGYTGNSAKHEQGNLLLLDGFIDKLETMERDGLLIPAHRRRFAL